MPPPARDSHCAAVIELEHVRRMRRPFLRDDASRSRSCRRLASHSLSRCARSARVARSSPANGSSSRASSRLARPGAREQHAPRLAVRHLRQRASRAARTMPKRRSARSACRRSAAGDGVIEPDARITARCDHLDHRHLRRMPGLQVRRDVGRAQLELLERHSRHDARAFDAAARRDRVIAVDRPQQRGLARAIRAMHHPAIASGNFQVDAVQDLHVVDVTRSARPSRDQHAAPLPAPARARRTRRAGTPAFLAEQCARLRGTHRAAALHATPLQLQQMRHRHPERLPRRCVANTHGRDEPAVLASHARNRA